MASAIPWLGYLGFMQAKKYGISINKMAWMDYLDPY